MQKTSGKVNVPQKSESHKKALPTCAQSGFVTSAAEWGSHIIGADKQSDSNLNHTTSFAETSPGIFSDSFSRIPIYSPSSSIVQAKLAISSPGDKYEVEADRIADDVLRMPNPVMSQPSTNHSAPFRSGLAVQRLCTKCSEKLEEKVQRQEDPEEGTMEEEQMPFFPEEEMTEETTSTSTASLVNDLYLSDEPVIVHRACSTCESIDDEKNAQRKSVHGGGESVDATSVVSTLLQSSSGTTLDTNVRSYMEPRFGVDFGSVRVHDNQSAAASARTLGAHAYTVGRHIVFGAGRYQPATQDGKRLLAHELTHVVQQSRTISMSNVSEMIPGYHAKHQARTAQSLPEPTVQREKIPHRDLTWEDFQKNPPKQSAYDASTASGFNPPNLKGLIPTELESTDTGEECVIKKSKKGDIMGTTYKIPIALDSAKIDVTAYMEQEKSWRKTWTTDVDARKSKCETGVVKSCNQYFTKQLKTVDKNCKTQEKGCKNAFKKDIESWSVEIEGTELKATSSDECTSEILEPCRELLAETLSYSSTMAGEEITANSKEECGVEFQQACIDDLLAAASDVLLGHEQGHFDITDSVAGQTRDALRALAEGFDQEVTICAKGDSEKAQKAAKKTVITKAKSILAKELKQLQNEYSKGLKKLQKTQIKYDKETKHGTIDEMQKAWQKNLEEGLEE